MSERIGCYWVDWRRLLMGLFIAGGIGAMDPAVALPKNTVVATIAVGDLPQGMAITPNGQTVYVVNYQSKDVSVIDTASNTITASITLASYPGAIAITPDSQTAFVLVSGNSTVAVIATATNTVTNTFTTGGWEELAVSPDGTQLYATDFTEGKVVIIDPGTFTTLNTIDTGGHPFYVQFAPDGKSAYVLGYTGFLLKIDVASQTIVWRGGYYNKDRTKGFAISPDGATLYVPKNKQSVLVFDAYNGSRKAEIQIVPPPPPKVFLGQPVVTPNGDFLYVPRESKDVVTMVTTADNKVVSGQIPVGVKPFWTVVAPNGNYLYVLNGGKGSTGSVSVVDISE